MRLWKFSYSCFSAKWGTILFCERFVGIPPWNLSWQTDRQRYKTMGMNLTWIDALRFFACGFIKSWVHKINISNNQELWKHIYLANNRITAYVLQIFRATVEEWLLNGQWPYWTVLKILVCNNNNTATTTIFQSLHKNGLNLRLLCTVTVHEREVHWCLFMVLRTNNNKIIIIIIMHCNCAQTGGALVPIYCTSYK